MPNLSCNEPNVEGLLEAIDRRLDFIVSLPREEALRQIGASQEAMQEVLGHVKALLIVALLNDDVPLMRHVVSFEERLQSIAKKLHAVGQKKLNQHMN